MSLTDYEAKVKELEGRLATQERLLEEVTHENTQLKEEIRAKSALLDRVAPIIAQQNQTIAQLQSLLKDLL